ncbi:MAG: hypothetical protein ACI4V1_07035 [Eubacteriales bacterium]
MKVYDIIFTEATVKACAAAMMLADAGKKILLLSRMSLLGWDYIAALSGNGQAWRYDAVHAKTAEFAEMLREKNILSPKAGGWDGVPEPHTSRETGETLPPIEPILQKMLLRTDADCLFMSRIAERRESDGKTVLKIFTTGGFLECAAETVIDCDPTVCAERVFFHCGMDFSDASETEAGSWAAETGITLIPARFVGEVYLRFEVPLDCTIAEARHRLMEIWRNRPEVWKKAKIVLPAPYFSYEYAGRPRHFLEAFDSGVTLAETILAGNGGQQ